MLLLSAPRRARWLGRLLKGLPGFLAFLQSSNDNPLGTDDYQKPGSFPSFLNFIGESLFAFPMSHIPPYFRWVSARLFFILQIASNSHYQRPVDCSVLEEVAEKIQAYCRHNRLLLLDPFHDPGNCKLFQSSFPVGHMSALSEGEDCLHRLARGNVKSVLNISLQVLKTHKCPNCSLVGECIFDEASADLHACRGCGFRWRVLAGEIEAIG